MALTATPKLHTIAARLPRGMHYGWVIVGLLVIVQILGSSIGMAAGVVVAPLSDPEGGFGWEHRPSKRGLDGLLLRRRAAACPYKWAGLETGNGARRLMLWAEDCCT